MGWIRLRDGATATAEDPIAACRGRIRELQDPAPRWKVVESFPTTVTGKIRKFQMRQMAIAELGLQPGRRDRDGVGVRPPAPRHGRRRARSSTDSRAPSGGSGDADREPNATDQRRGMVNLSRFVTARLPAASVATTASK
jgi:hypothetical protein